MVLSQIADVSPVPPWLSLVIQGGSFALVVFIVAYLYPKSAKEARDDRNERDDKWQALVATLQTKFEERNDKITAAFDRQTVFLSTSFADAAHRIEEAVVNVCRGKQIGTREGDHS
jgi:hypothetical protein